MMSLIYEWHISLRKKCQHYLILYSLLKGEKTFFSQERHDRSGSRIHDEIMAFSFCSANRVKYCGPVFNHIACAETVSLRQILGLPPATLKGKGVILSPEIYSDRRVNHTFTTLEMKVIRSLGIKLNLNPDEIFPKQFIEELQQLCKIALTPRQNEVVIHIRRGDVSPERHLDRYTEIDYYIDLIESLSKINPLLQYTVHSETQNLCNSEIQKLMKVSKLLLDADLVEAWSDFITAELLVLAKSSFSYVPALYSMGTVVYQAFWHLPKSEWLDIKYVSPQMIIDRINKKRI